MSANPITDEIGYHVWDGGAFDLDPLSEGSETNGLIQDRLPDQIDFEWLDGCRQSYAATGVFESGILAAWQLPPPALQAWENASRTAGIPYNTISNRGFIDARFESMKGLIDETKRSVRRGVDEVVKNSVAAYTEVRIGETGQLSTHEVYTPHFDGIESILSEKGISLFVACAIGVGSKFLPNTVIVKDPARLLEDSRELEDVNLGIEASPYAKWIKVNSGEVLLFGQTAYHEPPDTQEAIGSRALFAQGIEVSPNVIPITANSNNQPT